VPDRAAEVASRFAEYLRGLGADPALLARALAHVGVAPPAEDAAPVDAAAAEGADDPGLVPATFRLVAPAASERAPDAALLLPPPPGLAAADPLAETLRIRRTRPGHRLRRLLAVARVRAGAAGVSVAVHVGLLALFSIAIVVAAHLPAAPAVVVDVATPSTAAFEPEPAPPERPPAPSTAEATARIAVAASEAARAPIGDWRPEAGPSRAPSMDAPAHVALASRFDDLTSRVARSGALPALFADRVEPRRTAACRRENVPADVVPAVESALRWLAGHQRPDGLWSAGAQPCDHAECGGVAGDPAYDVGVTGLALLAIAAQGEGGREGEHAGAVARALAALARVRQPDGWIGERRGKGVYGHAIATCAALELAAMTGRPAAQALARGGLAALERERVAGLGWRYRADRGEADTAVTTWVGCAFAVATRLGWRVEPEALRTAVDWTRRQYDPATTRVGYLVRGDGGARLAGAVHDYPRAGAMSAAGAMLLLLAGAGADDAVVAGALTDVAQCLPVPQVRDGYAWQWGAGALHQVGGRASDEYARALRQVLLPSQVADGPARGCFRLEDAWTAAGGRVYATAMAALALQAPWRYARVAELR
jgi:hypothetical protein